MPSYARKHQLKSSLVYHVLNRANAKEEIFHSEQDYVYFRGLLSKYSRERKIPIYHWVIMPNHYHSLLELENPENISSVMAGIQRAYVYYHHKEYKSSGYLWQGRFKSQPIQKERYLLSCGRYIERNPVVANMVEQAEDYTHSSARFYLQNEEDNITTPDPLYNSFGNTALERQKGYREFLLGFDEQAEALFGDLAYPLGGRDFTRKLIKERGRYLPRRKGRTFVS